MATEVAVELEVGEVSSALEVVEEAAAALESCDGERGESAGLGDVAPAFVLSSVVAVVDAGASLARGDVSKSESLIGRGGRRRERERAKMVMMVMRSQRSGGRSLALSLRSSSILLASKLYGVQMELCACGELDCI